MLMEGSRSDSVSSGPFQLTIFSGWDCSDTTFSGELHAGEKLHCAADRTDGSGVSTEVQVSLSPTEEAEAEIKDEEKQRVLGVVPNFHVTYNMMQFPLSEAEVRAGLEDDH